MQKRLFTFFYLLLGFSLIPFSAMALAAADDPFPLTLGATWTYRGSDGTQAITTVKEEITRDDFTYFIVENSQGQQKYYLPLKDALLRIEAPHTAGQPGAVWVLIKQPLKKGSVWPALHSAGTKHEDLPFFRIEGQETFSTAGKTFENCYKIGFYTAGSPISTAASWYAPGIGPVKVAEYERDLVLTEYRPGQAGKQAKTLPTFKDWTQAAAGEGFFERLLPTGKQAQPAAPAKTARSLLNKRKGVSPMLIYVVPLLCVLFLVAAVFLLKRYLVSEADTLTTASKANLQMALAKIRAGEVQAALSTLGKDFPEDKEYPDVLYAVGLAYETVRRFEEALEKFDRSLALNPLYQKPLIARARCLKQLGRFDEAECDFRKVLQQNPHFPDIHNAVGELLTIKGKREQAIWHFEEALRLNPDFFEARENLEKLSA